HPEEAGVPADFGIVDELEGKLWLKERLEQILDRIPGELYHTAPYTLLRAAVEALLADPIAAAQALAQGAEGWEALVEAARRQAREQLVGSPEWRAARDVLRFNAGAEGDLLETARRTALRAAEQLEAGADFDAD